MHGLFPCPKGRAAKENQTQHAMSAQYSQIHYHAGPDAERKMISPDAKGCGPVMLSERAQHLAEAWNRADDGFIYTAVPILADRWDDRFEKGGAA